MDRLLFLLPLLACPVAMGLMMLFMHRGSKHESRPTESPLEPGERAELERLRVSRNSPQGGPVSGAGATADRVGT